MNPFKIRYNAVRNRAKDRYRNLATITSEIKIAGSQVQVSHNGQKSAE